MKGGPVHVLTSRATGVGGLHAPRRRLLSVLVLLLALAGLTTSVTAAASALNLALTQGGVQAGVPGDTHGSVAAVQAVISRPAPQDGDLGDLPETDTEERSREAPPLEILLGAAAVGLGVAFYLSRRRRPG